MNKDTKAKKRKSLGTIVWIYGLVVVVISEFHISRNLKLDFLGLLFGIGCMFLGTYLRTTPPDEW